MKKNPFCLAALALALCAVLVVVLALGRAILGRNTELVCDACGVSFVAPGYYSLAVAEDSELEALYGIDMYGFYCPDCMDPRFKGPLVSYGFSGSIEELEEKLQPYQERRAVAKKEEQNALFRTAAIFLAISGCAVGLFAIGRKKVND